MRDALGHESGVGFTVTRDGTAPVAWVRAPSACLSGTFEVSWGAQDQGAGPGGLYDVQYRVDNGAWTDWLTGTTATSAGFVGEMGHVYHFRVRTWDQVGNAREYPAAPDATTRIRAPVTKYYYASGQRVAMRQGDVVYYLHTDHLGSVSVLSDGSGHEVPGSAVRYLPYGGLRLGDASTLPTDYGFTGQRLNAGIGLYLMGARWYDPALGRWMQPDSIVPEHGDRQAAQWPLRVGVSKPQDIARVGEENRQTAQYGFWFQRGPEARQETVHPTGPTNPQELNRYAYCLGNPLRYADPSGEQWEIVFAVVVITVLVGPPVVLLIEDLIEASSSDQKEGPLATPEPSLTRNPENMPQGGPPLRPSSTPTPRWKVLLPTPTPTGPWAAIGPAMPTPTPTPTATLSPAEELYLRVNSWIPPEEVTPLEDAYGNPLYGPVLNPWLPPDPLRQPWYSK